MTVRQRLEAAAMFLMRARLARAANLDADTIASVRREFAAAARREAAGAEAERPALGKAA